MLSRQAPPRCICASLARWLRSQSCSRAKARVESTLAKDVCSQRPLKPSHKNCRSPGKHLARIHTGLIGSMYPFSLVGRALGPEFPSWGASRETSARLAQISDFRCQIFFSGAPLARPPPDSLRSAFFDDFGLRRLLGQICPSGTPFTRPPPDSLRSSIFHDFGTWQLLGQISLSAAPPPSPLSLLPPPSSLVTRWVSGRSGAQIPPGA